MNPEKPRSATLEIPSNSTPWLKQAFEAALLYDQHKIISEAEILIELLRKQQPRSGKVPSKLPFLEASGVIWEGIGDFHLFTRAVNPTDIVRLARRQGWTLSINVCRKTGHQRAMATGRLPPKASSKNHTSDALKEPAPSQSESAQ